MSRYTNPKDNLYQCPVCERFKEDHQLVVDSEGAVAAGVPGHRGELKACSSTNIKDLRSELASESVVRAGLEAALKSIWIILGNEGVWPTPDHVASGVAKSIEAQEDLLATLKALIAEHSTLLKESFEGIPTLNWKSRVSQLLTSSSGDAKSQINDLLAKERRALENVCRAAEKVDRAVAKQDQDSARASLRAALKTYRECRGEFSGLI